MAGTGLLVSPALAARLLNVGISFFFFLSFFLPLSFLFVCLFVFFRVCVQGAETVKTEDTNRGVTERVGPQILSLESIDYFARSDYFRSVVEKKRSTGRVL